MSQPATIHEFRGSNDPEPKEESAPAPFAMIPHAVRALKNPYATQVYLSLMMRANRDRVCWPSQALIAKESGVSERKVREMLALLVKHGMIRAEHQRHANAYFLVEANDIPPVIIDDVTRHAVPGENNNGEGHSARGAGQAAYSAGHSAPHAGHSARGAAKLYTRTKTIELEPKNKRAGGGSPAAPQAAAPSKSKTKLPKTQTEQERLSFVLVDAFARGCDRMPKDIVSKERYDARKAFEPLVDRYIPEDVEGCTRYLRTKPFWQDGNLSAIHVAKALPDWVAKDRPNSAVESGKPATETYRGSPIYDNRGNPTSAYFLKQAEELDEAERTSA